jgi:hypothetical protein
MSQVTYLGRKSTAASTAFTFERLVGADGRHLWLDGNAKITAGNGSYDEPAANAFSLLDRVDCPQRTPTCEAACYVQNLAAAQPELHAMYAHNSRTIREILASPLLRSAWTLLLGIWIRDNAPGGFRWHVSGDVISMDHARWIARVCHVASDVPCWIYTRSFRFLGPLLEVATVRGGNLAINLSADRDNYHRARAWSERLGLRVCYLSTTVGDMPPDMGRSPADVIFPDYPLRGPGGSPHAYREGSPFWQSLTPAQRKLVCPVDAYSKSESVRCGPCKRCLF